MRTRIGARAGALAVAASLLLGCSPPDAGVDEATAPEPASLVAKDLFESARLALAATSSVRYDFEFGEAGSPLGHAIGTTWMKRRTSLADSLIRVRGELSFPGASTIRFDYATDARTTTVHYPGESRAVSAPAGIGARGLAGEAIYGYLPEFVERLPYWKELGSAERYEILPDAVVDGVACRIVAATYHLGQDTQTRHVWAFGTDDLLPRRLDWYDNTTGPGGGRMVLTELEVAPLDEDDFQLSLTGDVTLEQLASLELDRPIDWEGTSEDGSVIESDALRGDVIVLDFWNTWCFICRALQPQMDRVASDYEGEDVAIWAPNVFETGDAGAYWSELRKTYGYLTNADTIAQAFDIPWQPAVVVLGRDGRTLLNLLGADGDREEQIRRAIDTGLAQRP